MLWGDGCDWQLSWTAFMTNGALLVDMTTYDQQKSFGLRADQLHLADRRVAPTWLRRRLAPRHRSRRMRGRLTSSTASTTVDGAAPVALALDLLRMDTPMSVSVAIGVPCVQTMGGCFAWDGSDWRVLFDNVTLHTPEPLITTPNVFARMWMSSHGDQLRT